MVEALALVGLACNVVQFLDVGGKTISYIRELYKAGSLKENAEIEDRILLLQASLEKFKEGPLLQQEEKLSALVKGSLLLSNDLMAIIQDLKPKKQRNQLLEATSKSLKTVRKRGEIKDMERRLGAMQDSVCTYLRVTLSKRQDELTPKVKDLVELTKGLKNEQNARLDAMVANIQIILRYCRNWSQGDNITFTDLTNHLRRFVDEAQESKKVVEILKSLHFKQIKERHSDIRDAHRQTFAWVFDPHSRVNFVSWLRSSGSIYWIAGKAGSGKSTLMKFIQGHHMTQELLRHWARSQGLIIATHYFWSAGTTLQKTQVGLFRTLLFQILTQCLELIPQVLPDRWKGSAFVFEESWTRAELFAAFRKLAELPQLSTKFCFFVDGLDEYSGDHPELINIIHILSGSPNIKICVSSRPWQYFVDAFEALEWKLYVQDLTKNDIRLYVKDNLERNSTFLRLRVRDRAGSDTLVGQIQLRAHGVFLWVYLVVRSLLRGLINSDEMIDLHRRLNELPTELEKYFELMLDTIEPIYQQQTARVFRVMLASTGTLPVITFHFVNKERSRQAYALEEPIQPLSVHEIQALIDQQRRQLNASCRDLLFISIDREEHTFQATTVGFLHRTVTDFLRTSQMDILLSTRSGTEFNPTSSLCKAHWAMFKAAPKDSIRKLFVETIPGEMVRRTLYYAREVEMQSGYSEIVILDDLAKNLSQQTSWGDLVSGPYWDDLPDDFLDLAVCLDLQLYVIEKTRKTREFLGQITKGLKGNNERNQMAKVLRAALRRRLDIEGNGYFQFCMKNEIGLSMLQYLLEHSTDPDAMFFEAAGNDNVWIWGDFVKRLNQDHQKMGYIKEEWDMTKFLGQHANARRKLPSNAFEACELMITHGASRIDDVYQIFPENEDKLRRMFDKNEAPIEEPNFGILDRYTSQKQLCTVM
ncbi:hypothetical protein K469DRAFT_640898 [Zopfia rhizophila CBS 207.26]|uniref:NACHT domain-containing protein n=1 Tax=Zopfia rhizophila CBS 207.26 TaxID=1314779 RepID=A0A6A6DJB9_9PEZI|nr:hypothetical protein K469DRAFT_640898 [Zopfia rhizophila CBS 207.26]